MDARLQRLVVDRLDAETALGDDVAYLVLAACEGAQSLTDMLGGRGATAAAPPAAPDPIDPPAVYLRAITVEGFRGIGPAARLALEPGPGLTLVMGRNGTGKSSFAEGLELCLTGSNRRWAERTAVWKDGWRNLHQPDPCSVGAELCVDGVPGVVTVVRAWGAGDGLEAAVTSLTGHPEAAELDDLGWRPALTALRPFLSYNELGRMFETPSAFYDALAGILGLDDLLMVSTLLKDERTARERALKVSREKVPELLLGLDGMDDERAVACHEALSLRIWDLEKIELAVGGAVETGDPEGDQAILRALSQVHPPQVEVTPQALRHAADERDKVSATNAGSAMRVADLLQRGLAHHDHEGDGPCPVCSQGHLDQGWHAAAEQELQRLRDAAISATTADDAVTEAMATIRRAFDPEPPALARADRVGIDATEAREAWTAWLAGRSVTDPRVMADHVERSGPALASALANLRTTSAAEVERREDAWRPVARDLREWLAPATAAVAGARRVADLRAAEEWVKKATDSVRAERFAPIADAASAHWATLRQSSSVQITTIGLAGSATQRRVEIDVQVDGVGSAALGVMSQGELCSLALCMFLPRATLSESPFRFVVIDDPVQSMDPAKVEGLARVLESVAATRQVVVFTHDDRLAEAVRRLRVPARVVEVNRREASIVELTPGVDPVEARLDDARAAARDPNLPAQIAARVVPGLCRQAIEAGAADTVRRRRLSRGEPHAEVEELLEGVVGLYEWLALALFDDRGKESQGKVLPRLNNDRTFGWRVANAFLDCNSGAHGAYKGSLADLAGDAARLARELANRA